MVSAKSSLDSKTASKTPKRKTSPTKGSRQSSTDDSNSKLAKYASPQALSGQKRKKTSNISPATKTKSHSATSNKDTITFSQLNVNASILNKNSVLDRHYEQIDDELSILLPRGTRRYPDDEFITLHCRDYFNKKCYTPPPCVPRTM